MNIGIVGTGAIGSILAKEFANAGHKVKVTNTRDMPKLRKIADDLGAEAATSKGVVEDVDVIIFSIPFKAFEDLPNNLLQDVPKEVLVIDTSNYYPFRDGKIPEVEDQPESMWTSEKLGRPVIKLFNNIMEYTLKHKGKAAGEEGRIAIAVSGDNQEHKNIASGLADLTGFDTVDNGSLSESWRQQPGTPAYCTELTAPELIQALALAEPGKAPEARDEMMDKLQSQDNPSHADMLALNRSEFFGSVGEEYKG